MMQFIQTVLLAFQIKNIKLENGEMLDIVQQQKLLIDELVLREPEKVKKLKKQKNQLIAQQEGVKGELESLRKSNDKFKNELERNTEKIGRLTIELERVRADVDEKDEMNSALKGEVNLLKKMVEEMTKREIEYKEGYTSKEKQVAELEEEISKQHSICSEKQSRIVELERDLQGLQNIQKEKDFEIHDLKKELDSLTCQVAASVVKIATSNAFRTEAFKTELAEVQRKNMEQCKKIDLLTEVNKEISNKVKQLQKHNEEYEAAIKSSEKQLEEAKTEGRAKTEQLQEMVDANRDLLLINGNLNEEITVQNEQLVRMEENLRDIVKMCAAEKRKNDDLIDNMRVIENKLKKVEDTVENGIKLKKTIFQRVMSRFRSSS